MVIWFIEFIGWGICFGYAINDTEEVPWWGSIALIFFWPIHLGFIIYEMTHREEDSYENKGGL